MKARTCAVEMKYKASNESVALWASTGTEPTLKLMVQKLGAQTTTEATLVSLFGSNMSEAVRKQVWDTYKDRASLVFAKSGGLQGAYISFSPATVTYTVRNSEGQSDSSFFVQSSTPSATDIASISWLEGLSEAHRATRETTKPSPR